MRSPHYIEIQDLPPFSFVCLAIFSFAFCSCLFIFCFRPLSLSFLPLSPIVHLLAFISLCVSPCLYLPLCASLLLYHTVHLFFRLSLIFSVRGCRCIVSSVFAFPHSVEIQDLTPFPSLLVNGFHQLCRVPRQFG
jgi:hypothetical protein